MCNLTRVLARGCQSYIASDVDVEHLSCFETQLRHQPYLETRACDLSNSAEVERLLTERQISQIQHRTEVRSPQTNGFCERFHRTLKEEFFTVAFRKTIYKSAAQLQNDLDRYLEFYNRERAHRGYRTQGRPS